MFCKELHIPTQLLSNNSHDKLIITDETGRDVYTIHSKLFPVHHTIFINDSHGYQVAKLVQERGHIHRTFNIYTGNQLYAKMVKKFSLTGNYDLQAEGNDPFMVYGSLPSHNFGISQNNAIIGRVTKKSAASGDSYHLQLATLDQHLELFFVAVTIAIGIKTCRRSSLPRPIRQPAN